LVARYIHHEPERTHEPAVADGLPQKEGNRELARFELAILIRFYMLALLVTMLTPFLIHGSGLDFMGALDQALSVLFAALAAFIVWNLLILVPIVGTKLWESLYVQDFLAGISAVLYAVFRDGVQVRFTRDQLTGAPAQLFLLAQLFLFAFVSILVSIAIAKGLTYPIAFVTEPFTDYEPIGIDERGEVEYVNTSPPFVKFISLAPGLVIITWSRLLPIIWFSHFLVGN
jgi:hypothetical protein